MPGEIDAYFDMMDTDHDENLSLKEIEFGYAMFRYLIYIASLRTVHHNFIIILGLRLTTSISSLLPLMPML